MDHSRLELQLVVLTIVAVLVVVAAVVVAVVAVVAEDSHICQLQCSRFND